MSDLTRPTWRPNPADSPYTFQSPAISAVYHAGWWTVTREGKGDWLQFRSSGGLLYRSGEADPVGTIYLGDHTSDADIDPYFSWNFTRSCECGSGRIGDHRIETFRTAADAIEGAAFHFLS